MNGHVRPTPHHAERVGGVIPHVEQEIETVSSDDTASSCSTRSRRTKESLGSSLTLAAEPVPVTVTFAGQARVAAIP